MIGPSWLRSRSWLLAAVALGGAWASQAAASHVSHLFCHANKRCQEKPPKWKIQRVCPKPICDPCLLEHHGYYHTCWRPSTVPPDWSHCPVPPPAVVYFPGPGQPGPDGSMPAPAADPGQPAGEPPLGAPRRLPAGVTPPPLLDPPPGSDQGPPAPPQKPAVYLPESQ